MSAKCHKQTSRHLFGAVLADTLQVSIGGERPHRRHIKVRRRHDAGHALRSGADPANALDTMVLAQGLGDADRQASRHEEGDRSIGTPAGRHHAPHLD